MESVVKRSEFIAENENLIAPELVSFGADSRLRLRAGRCASCGHETFPMADVCPSCLSVEVTPFALDGNGTLYSYSIVHAAPAHWKAPYALGYVDLPGGLRVLGQIQAPVEKIRIGDAMTLSLGVVGTAANGQPASTYVFVPEN